MNEEDSIHNTTTNILSYLIGVINMIICMYYFICVLTKTIIINKKTMHVNLHFCLLHVIKNDFLNIVLLSMTRQFLMMKYYHFDDDFGF